MEIPNNSNHSDRNEVVTELIGFEFSKLWNTARDLTLKPGVAIDDYVKGDRKKYLSPISYFLLIFGISFFLDSVTGVSDYILNRSFNQQDFAKGVHIAEKVDGKKMSFDVDKLSVKVSSETKAFYERKEAQLLMLLPGLLLCQWLFFRKTKSFLHNSYFALFTAAQYTLLFTPLYLLFFLSENLFFYAYMILGITFPIVFNIYSSAPFYTTDWRKLVFKNILLQIAVVIVTVLFNGLIGGVIGIYTALVQVKGG